MVLTITRQRRFLALQKALDTAWDPRLGLTGPA
jgi:hypothetical protein